MQVIRRNDAWGSLRMATTLSEEPRVLGGQQGPLLGEVPLFLPHSASRIRRKRGAQQGRPWTPAQRWALRRAAGCEVSRLQSGCRPPCSPAPGLAATLTTHFCPDVKQAKFLSLQPSHYQ